MINLNTISLESIDDKIRMNENDGIDIYKLRSEIRKELKDFQWIALRAQVQCQSYTEQLEHIENRIKELETTGEKKWLLTV